MPEKINFSNANQARKTTVNFNLKKNSSEANFLEIENRSLVGENTKSRPKLNTKNYVTAKKNYAFVERLSKDKLINRPSITGPSLLKNKSFIYTHKNEGKENYLSRPSHDGFRAPPMFP